jgi:hypothetical protein
MEGDAMLGRKPAPIDYALAQRVRRIAQPEDVADADCAEAPAAEREPRSPTFKPATLTFHGDRLEVVVKNLSATGARVEFIRDVQLPERVVLSEPSTGLRRTAHVAWQTWGIAGLEFLDPETRPSVGPPRT